MRYMLANKNKELVENFVGQFINVEFKLIVLYTLLRKCIRVVGLFDHMNLKFSKFSHL